MNTPEIPAENEILIAVDSATQALLLENSAGDRTGKRLREAEEAVVAEMRDSGRGIASGVLDKLIEPFFSTKSSGKGMGLGLTVARKIVKTHSGRISVCNADEVATLVTLAFQLA